MKVHNDLKELLEHFVKEYLQKRNPNEIDLYDLIDEFSCSNSLALGKPEPLAKNKQCDDNFNCDWYNDPDFPNTKCETQCSTCFAANDF